MKEYIIPVKVPANLENLNIDILKFSNMMYEYLRNTPSINDLEIINWDLNPEIWEFYVLVSVPDTKEFNPSGDFLVRWETDYSSIKELRYKERGKHEV